MATHTLVLQDKKIHVGLTERADQLTCRDFLKLVEIGKQGQGTVFFSVDSGRVRLDVPALYSGYTMRALHACGFHGRVSSETSGPHDCRVTQGRGKSLSSPHSFKQPKRQKVGERKIGTHCAK